MRTLRAFMLVFVLALTSVFVLGMENTWASTDNVALDKPVRASSVYASEYREYEASRAVDGDWEAEASRWISGSGREAPHWLEIALRQAHRLEGAEVWTGVPGRDDHRVSNFRLQYWRDGGWVDIPGTVVEGNTNEVVSFTFSSPIMTDRVRFYSEENQDRVRVREILLYGSLVN